MKRRRYHSLDDLLPSRIRERVLLWIVTPFPTVVALLFLVDMLDGRTGLTTTGEISLWGQPLAFAAASGLCALFCIIAAMFWLALIDNWNTTWLPPRLRDRPYLAIVWLLVLTASATLMGSQLLTGEFTLSGKGSRLIGRHLSVDGTPVRFTAACVVYFGFCAGIALGWYLTLKRWVDGPPRRWRPTFDDLSKRAGLR